MSRTTSASTTPELTPQAPPPAYPGEALDAAIRAARMASPQFTGVDGRHYLALPKDFSLHELKDEARLDPIPRASITVDDRASLVAYANRFKDARSLLIADFDALTIAARLDWHPHNQHSDFQTSGARSHTVTHKLRLSEEFARWDDMAAKFHSQADFAQFLEENSADIAMPEAATMVEISRDLEATTGSIFKSSVRLENGDRALRYETDTRAVNQVVIPTRFELLIPIYNGEAPIQLTCRFRWRATGGGAQLGFEWHRVEYQRRAHFAQIATAAAEETGLPVVFGRPT
jgi:uncharacterized protein YfdQ (DUF2303 family)